MIILMQLNNDIDVGETVGAIVGVMVGARVLLLILLLLILLLLILSIVAEFGVGNIFEIDLFLVVGIV